MMVEDRGEPKADVFTGGKIILTLSSEYDESGGINEKGLDD
jgi:hypothetical protein